MNLRIEVTTDIATVRKLCIRVRLIYEIAQPRKSSDASLINLYGLSAPEETREGVTVLYLLSNAILMKRLKFTYTLRRLRWSSP